MPIVKTAISMEERIFRHVQEMSDAMNISRSQVIARAVELMVAKQRNAAMLDQLNRAVSKGLDAKEVKALKGMKRKQARLVRGTW